MPPAIKNGKSKGREGMQSRSRNTTPSSIASAPLASTPSNTSCLDIPIPNLMVPTNISYDDILDRHGGSGGIPDPSHLTMMVKDLKQLCDLADARCQTCVEGIQLIEERRRAINEKELEREREREQTSRTKEIEERESLQREVEDDDNSRGRKASKVKKRKDPSSVREERPLNHGAHGLARQDGLELPLKGTSRIHSSKSFRCSLCLPITLYSRNI